MRRRLSKLPPIRLPRKLPLQKKPEIGSGDEPAPGQPTTDLKALMKQTEELLKVCWITLRSEFVSATLLNTFSVCSEIGCLSQSSGCYKGVWYGTFCFCRAIASSLAGPVLALP